MRIEWAYWLFGYFVSSVGSERSLSYHYHLESNSSADVVCNGNISVFVNGTLGVRYNVTIGTLPASPFSLVGYLTIGYIQWWFRSWIQNTSYSKHVLTNTETLYNIDSENIHRISQYFHTRWIKSLQENHTCDLTNSTPTYTYQVNVNNTNYLTLTSSGWQDRLNYTVINSTHFNLTESNITNIQKYLNTTCIERLRNYTLESVYTTTVPQNVTTSQHVTTTLHTTPRGTTIQDTTQRHTVQTPSFNDTHNVTEHTLNISYVLSQKTNNTTSPWVYAIPMGATATIGAGLYIRKHFTPMRFVYEVWRGQ
ncbi:membrane glycoprotein UL142 [Human betaherpesvirus 5]|uniref:Membrane glycoprotein UL142 n=1 Tax=Human cytomegalovirus TaxID=10359 RepID=A0A0G2TEI4_HCMV|nr:membrane glycoprotein UL142 [Human betaherpesvirus 5]